MLAQDMTNKRFMFPLSLHITSYGIKYNQEYGGMRVADNPEFLHILYSAYLYNKTKETVCFHIPLALLYSFISEQLLLLPALTYLPKPLHAAIFFLTSRIFSFNLSNYGGKKEPLEQQEFSLLLIYTIQLTRC